MRTSLLALPLALATSCAATQKTAPRPGSALDPVFARMANEARGAGLYVDADAIERAGFTHAGASLRAFGELASWMAAWIPADDPDAARATAAFVLFSQAEKLPPVHRLGVLVPPGAFELPAKAALARSALVVEVEQGLAANREFVASAAALWRAARPGGAQPVQRGGDDVCAGASADALCLRAGDRFLALGSTAALDDALSAPAPAAPLPAGALVAMRAALPRGSGRVDVTFEDGLALRGFVEGADPDLATGLARFLHGQIAELDDAWAKRRRALDASRAELRAALSKDPAAPPRLVQAAQQLDVNRALDPHGWLDALRRSLRVTRIGTRVAFEARLPAGAVRMLAGDAAGPALWVGVMAAVAIPNFLRYQCRARQTEARVNLGLIARAAQRFNVATRRWPVSQKELEVKLEGPRYTYCFAGGCLACGPAGCAPANPSPNPCAGFYRSGPDGFSACAFWMQPGAGHPDVWLIDQDLDLRHPLDMCGAGPER